MAGGPGLGVKPLELSPFLCGNGGGFAMVGVMLVLDGWQGWEESCHWEVILKLLQESWPRIWSSHEPVQEETELSSCLHGRKQHFWLPQEPV